MFWLIPLALGGVTALVLGLNAVAAEERARFELEYLRVLDDVVRERQAIEKRILQYSDEQDFHVLCQHHYVAFRMADQAHGLLRDARKSFRAIGKTLGRAKAKRDELKGKLRHCRFKNERQRLSREIEGYQQLRRSLFSDRDKLQVEMDSLLVEVQGLNKCSVALKSAIHERCGTRGREWYEQLQARAAARRLVQATQPLGGSARLPAI